MKRLLIYPFLKQHFAFIRALTHSSELEVGTLCSYEGSGLIGKDVAYAVNRRPFGMRVEGNPLEHLESNDVLVLLPEFPQNETSLKLKLLQRAKELNKEIYCYCSLSKDYNIKLNNIEDNALGLFNVMKSLIGDLIPISTPTVFVGGLIEDGDQLEVAVSITQELRNAGYSVSCFSNYAYMELCGLHSYQFVVDEYINNAPIMAKNLNQFVNAVINVDKPDIIVVQVPGVTIRYNDSIIGDLGIYTYLFAQVVGADFFICCTPFDNYNNAIYNALSEEFKHKFGFEINAVHVSNRLFDWPKTLEYVKESFFQVSEDDVDSYINSINSTTSIPVLNMVSSKISRRICDLIEERLK